MVLRMLAEAVAIPAAAVAAACVRAAVAVRVAVAACAQAAAVARVSAVAVVARGTLVAVAVDVNSAAGLRQPDRPRNLVRGVIVLSKILPTVQALAERHSTIIRETITRGAVRTVQVRTGPARIAMRACGPTPYAAY